MVVGDKRVHDLRVRIFEKEDVEMVVFTERAREATADYLQSPHIAAPSFVKAGMLSQSGLDPVHIGRMCFLEQMAESEVLLRHTYGQWQSDES